MTDLMIGLMMRQMTSARWPTDVPQDVNQDVKCHVCRQPAINSYKHDIAS